MKKFFLASLISFIVAASIPITANAAPYCGITWGSGAKSSGPSYSSHQLTNIRTGRHDCFDRMVFDLNGSASGYDVRYVSNVYTEGEGALVPLAGGAKLQIILRAAAYNNAYQPTYPGRDNQPLPGVNLSGYQTFRQAKFAGSFEGQTTVGLGVRAQLPFRVFKEGNRVVLDVAHRW
jgi:hypothetical protein